MNLFVNPGNALVTTDKDATTDAEAMALIHNQLTGYAGEIVLAGLASDLPN